MHTFLKALGACSALLTTPYRVPAQWTFLDLPVESQAASISQRIGTTDISITYSRPAVKGRVIWGEVVPYGQVWRAGANDNTVVTFSSEMKVEGQVLPAGTYGLHMIPTATTWTVIFSKDSRSWGSFFYKPEQDALRVTVDPRPCPATEYLTYDLAPLKASEAELTLRWAQLAVPIRIAVDVDQVVLAHMDDQLKGLSAFNWEPWYEAARYCHDAHIAPDKAMKWVDVSIARQPNFENRMLKAEMLTTQGKKAEAEALRKIMIDEATNGQLNTYAYQLLQKGEKAEAVRMFELNAKRHALDPNVHDSLGEGYMTAGNKDAAIKAFKKSLSMNPPDGVKANSIKCLKQLGVDTSAWEATK
ncbi:MAG: DUF2911 domain-containing protein [Flavobacteriales bacterium]|nr:DUF2911 domain-containing protein [Flavobacteriales bacterium]